MLAENLGGEANALTSKDHVVFFATTSPDEIEAVARQSIDDIVRPALDDQVVERERSIVEAELRGAAADPRDYVYDRWGVEALGCDAFARPTGGTLADVERLTTDRLVSAHAKRVHSGNVRVVAVGRISPEQALAVAEQSVLSDLPAGDWQPGSEGVALRAEPDLDHDDDSSDDQAVVMLGGVGPGISDPDGLAAATIVDAVLGGSPAARLPRRLRYERALVYECQSTYTAFRDRGLWRATVVVDAAAVPALLEEGQDVITRSIDELSVEDIERGRRAAVGRCLLSRDQWFDRMLWVGEALDAGWQGDVEEELLARLRLVDAPTVRSTLASTFDEGLIFAATGDVRSGWSRGRLEVG